MRGSGAGGSFPERRAADCRASPSTDSPAGSRPLSQSAHARKDRLVPAAPTDTAPAHRCSLARSGAPETSVGTYRWKYEAK